MEDHAIVSLYFERDEEALAQTAAAYETRLMGLARRILHSDEAAEECVNDTYWKLWNAIPPAKPQNLFAYAMQVCRHTAFGMLDYQNADKRSATVVTLSDELTACLPDRAQEHAYTEEEFYEILNAFLASLKADQRRVFVRRYGYAASVEEIARHYRVSQSYVKTTLHRTRKQLKTYLEKEGITV